jgi:hypothetical protein
MTRSFQPTLEDRWLLRVLTKTTQAPIINNTKNSFDPKPNPPTDDGVDDSSGLANCGASFSPASTASCGAVTSRLSPSFAGFAEPSRPLRNDEKNHQSIHRNNLGRGFGGFLHNLQLRADTFIGNLQLAALGDLDRLLGLVARVLVQVLDLVDNLIALEHLAKDDVAPVQPRGNGSSYEKLATIRILARVGHGEKARLAVLQLEVLVGELLAVDGLATSTCAIGSAFVALLLLILQLFSYHRHW